MKYGIFGGTFNPPHNGHLTLTQSLQKKLGFDRIFVVPNHMSPLKAQTDSPSAEHRAEMTKLAFATYGDKFEVDLREVSRGEMSFTIDTIRSFAKEYPNDQGFLLLGEDQFEQLDKWKDSAAILESIDLVVASRPNHHFPTTLEEMPKVVRSCAIDFGFNRVELKTQKSIQFVTIPEVEISATELRKKLRTRQPVERFLPLSVESYIRDQGLYRNLAEKIKDYRAFTAFCAQFLDSKKAININALDMTEMSAPFEYAIITSGTSTRQTTALGQSLVQAVKQEFGLFPQGIEGVIEGRWVAIDYGSLSVHIFYDFVRQEYSLENIWKTAAKLDWAQTKPLNG